VKVVRKGIASDGWFVTGEEIVVLAVSFSKSDGVSFVVWSALQGCSISCSADDFDVIDGCMSSRWVIGISGSGYTLLAPERWQVNGFWERYHDEDYGAIQDFDEEMRLMVAE
jgi:hypothetical protein